MRKKEDPEEMMAVSTVKLIMNYIPKPHNHIKMEFHRKLALLASETYATY